jgi:hypothetical protein
MDEHDDEPTPIASADPELNQLLGLFDVPAFVRRGQDLEYALARLHDRCRRQRHAMLDMVRLRLRQWARAASGPTAWSTTFTAPIDPLWLLCGAEPPEWAGADAAVPPRRRLAIARDLVASINRFNRRWSHFLEELDLEPMNKRIDQYNRYYLLEKECSLGSARLAARHYDPKPRLTHELLRAEYPVLPVPEVVG